MAVKNISNKLLIALLKRNNIRKLILSSGARNIPFISAVEVDDYFKCYSVVDERNAAFFALGLSQQNNNEPIAIACTSGTAASNYLTGITEAYYSHTPILAITFDRSTYTLNQLETQKVNQPAIFEAVTKKSVTLPIIKDEDDVWYCQRLINEAMIALHQRGFGPVHINIPLGGDTNMLNVKDEEVFDSPQYIEYYSNTDYLTWHKALDELNGSKRVLLVMGRHFPLNETYKEKIKSFVSKYHIPVLADNLSNFRCDEMIMAEALIKALNSKTITPLMPDLIISFGTNFQERIKDIFKARHGEYKHWSIDSEGIVRDVFRSETALFESTPEQFFEFMNSHTEEVSNVSERISYLDLWREYENAATIPDNLPWTNLHVARRFSEVIPNNSILHLAILNSTRVHQFFKLDESIKVYSNVDTFGIDGCLPTFMGQAETTDELAFIVIGDLSFFYGMNALAIKHRKNNVRVMVINNKGAAEFHIQPDSHNRPTVDLHIGCEHNRSAKGWAESIGYKYLTADDDSTLTAAFEEFIRKDQESPVLLEVFTDKTVDGPSMLAVYRHLEERIKSLQSK